MVQPLPVEDQDHGLDHLRQSRDTMKRLEDQSSCWDGGRHFYLRVALALLLPAEADL